MVALAEKESVKPPFNAADCKSAILRAMGDPEEWALCLHYLDRDNRLTKRYVSPIRFVASDRFLALCLCREEPRQFYLDRCVLVELVASAELLMPMAIG